MDLRSALFGSTLRVVLVAVVGVAGLGVAAFAFGVLGVPGVVGVENAFGPVNDTATVIETDLTVNNPNPIGLRLGSLEVDYGVNMNDVSMASGVKRGVAIGTGNSTVNFTTLLYNDRIPPWWVSHIRNGEQTDLSVNATVSSGLVGRSATVTPVERNISTNIIGQFNSTETREVNADTALVEDPVAYINETNATWGEVTASETPIEAEFVVYNPKSYPLTVTELGYNITMNEVAMGEGTTERSYTIPPNTARTLDATLAIRNDNLDEWWVSHLERNQRTNLTVDFTLRIDAGATTVEVPLRGMTEERVIETDFFGNKGVDDGTSDSGSDSDSETTTTDDGTTTTDDGTTTTDDGTTTTDDGTTTTDDGTTTAEETTTTEETTTEENTTTDDGGGLLAVAPRS